MLIDVICILGLGSAAQIVLSNHNTKEKVRPRRTQIAACHSKLTHEYHCDGCTYVRLFLRALWACAS